MWWKLAFDDVTAKRFGDLYINGKFPVDACVCKIWHEHNYVKRSKAKQVLGAESLALLPHSPNLINKKKEKVRLKEKLILFSLPRLRQDCR